MKKLLCVFCTAVLLVSLAGCGKKEQAVTVVTEDLTSVKSQYIDAKVAANLEKKEVFRAGDVVYYETIVEGRRVLCRTDQQERLKILLTFSGEPTFYTETLERSNGIFLYFTYKFEGAASANLYALNISNDRIMTVMASPCSNFIMLNLPDTYEMYPYGFIAAADGVKAIDLRSGGASSQYSMTISQMKLFFVEPDSFPEKFFGDNYSASLSEMGDREHIRIDVVEKDKDGGVRNKWAVKFTPKLGVTLEITE